jgi:2,3-bisphosphoglycerate-independent phosphoglycerate mutase
VEKYIKQQHQSGITDEFIEPAMVKSANFTKVEENDYILFFNFREDRLRQIVKKCESLSCRLGTMAEVGGVKTDVIYPNKIVKNTLSEYLSQQGLKQIKISESTKYAHVTYFLNGGREEPFEGEDRVHVPTRKTTDFAKSPKMRAVEITKQTIKAIKKGYDVVIVNYSNPDMIGHTGNYNAVVTALECVDKCVDKVIKQANKQGYFVLITADHGNAEEMRTKENELQTAHTINPVFCVETSGKYQMKESGELKDVAPTFVQLLGLKPNKKFEGKSLLL